RKERPDAILPGIGGQTGLNLAMQLARKGILDECRVELLGTDLTCIEQAEDREKFKDLCQSLNEPILPSMIAESMEEGLAAAASIGYPVVIRPAFTLGGTGGGFANDEAECREILKNALSLSPVHQALVEKSVRGYKEIEYEVIRDANDTAITICNMENVDPVGIHTGDSIVVCPSQTLTNREYHMLRDSALKIIRALRIEGGCNVQFALDPKSFQYYLIEVNPRVSRSSALASKASGYPIARVSAKISVGYRLDEIRLANTPASFEPSLDYVVFKLPRFPFDKFTDANPELGTQMKATGEVMSVGRTMEESLLKGIRSLETGIVHLHAPAFDHSGSTDLLQAIENGTDDRIFAIAELLRRKTPVETIAGITGIDALFLRAMEHIVRMEEELLASVGDNDALYEAKRMGFSDAGIALLWNRTPREIFRQRQEADMFPSYKMIDSCASEFKSYIPYFYSTYEGENESVSDDTEKIIVLGSGPIRIGQGVEFDYSTVHAVKTIRSLGYQAIVINNNPETVSTDYTTSDKLYFEPLCTEDVMNIIMHEKPKGVIVTLGGQTAVNLAESLEEYGAKIVGTDCMAIERAENRDAFEKILFELGIPQPKGVAVTSVSEGIEAAARIGYPVLVRPSFVLGGRAMQIVSKEEELKTYLKTAVEIDTDKPVLVDHYIMGKEIEVDAVCDGTDVFVPGIMELVERTGVHSGDSISVYPPYSISEKVQETIREYTEKLGLGIGIRGLFNVQFIVDDEERVYIIEVNPRSSRTVPFLSKATGFMLADIATKVMLGHSLQEQGVFTEDPGKKKRWYVKVPAFSFAKLKGMDSYLSPEMKSTGEAIGYDEKIHRAMFKALIASGIRLQNYGTVLVTLADEDKEEALPLVRRFYELGFNIEATVGTAVYLKEHGIRTRIRRKLSEGSEEILHSIRAGYVSYVINTRAIRSGVHYEDGVAIRRCARENNITMFTSLDTVRVLLDVLEELTICVSTISE
ncbi:MAG: carbamoyl-phosphate synthase large subunit, partial [Lachnospiraceae bacterium]|nr:carbamoyl-phosphate synthase large subunit [Lachnospiraceae bacterium]